MRTELGCKNFVPNDNDEFLLDIYLESLILHLDIPTCKDLQDQRYTQ